MIIYKITNLIDNKIYIGYKKHFISEKELLLSNYYGSGVLIKKAIKKYGNENFKREVLEICDSIESMLNQEIYWIKELNSQVPNGYNILPGGIFGDTISHNPNKIEICKKMSIAQRKKYEDPKEREKTSIGAKNMSSESKKRRSEKISLALSGKNHPGYGKKHAKKEVKL